MTESDLSQEEELAVLKEQHALLTRLLHQQQEVSNRNTRSDGSSLSTKSR